MIIQSLSVENFRSHKKFSRSLSDTVTVITGPNGSGKTSLIEAIMVALGGKSFKGTDSELLRRGADWWRVDVKLDNQDRTVKYQPDAPKKKQFIVDDKANIRLPTTSRYPIVLFEPEDLRLLHGSPSRRRQFIDRFAAELIPDYGKVVRRYERALLQRNKLLKRRVATDELFAWNVSLAKYGAQMIDMRVRLIERLNAGLQPTYNTIAQTRDVVSLHYSHTVIDHTEQKLLSELEARTERDQILGFTSIGPHRHDVLFRFNDAPAIGSASRGEVRTIILALKFLEVDIVQQVTDQPPIVLLDDVLSELDDKRQSHLATKFQNHQIIMTSTNPPEVLGSAKVIRLR
ncbi:MAG: recF [Candidatus Saccharibacteria bacterium]|nr:recF [Candidatus Saccharibacteria bacterium]